MKSIGFMTNAKGIVNQLSERCNGKHQHVKLLDGRASRAEVYPDELCLRIFKGLMETMKMDGRIQSNGIGAVMAEEESQSWDQINQAWDDITGEELDPSAVATARREEMDEIRKHEVYCKRKISECWDKTGKAPIKL